MNETRLYTAQFKDKLLTRVYNFEETCIEAFSFQYRHNEIYKTYCSHLGIKQSSIQSITDIPFLPIEFFKQHKISVHTDQHQKIYTSSGTSGSTTSKHYIYDSSFYLKNASIIFEQNYGSIKDAIFLFLLPSYLEREGSSLVEMANHFVNQSDSSLSGFFLNEYDLLTHTLKKALDTNKQVFLFGVSFGLLDFIDAKNSLSNSKNLTIIETGGMKGRRKELTRQELHSIIKSNLGTKTVHSEYGMTELLSQAYSKGNGVFRNNDTLKTLIREIKDPLSIHLQGKGGINIIDLANIDSCCFLATSDQGVLNNNEFEIIGRLDHSDSRGCNLMIQ